DGKNVPPTVQEGQRLRMIMRNRTMMPHPMHVHGHTWALQRSGGLRKDTVLMLPHATVVADLIADNPGEWAFRCHNAYHQESGMMTPLRYEYPPDTRSGSARSRPPQAPTYRRVAPAPVIWPRGISRSSAAPPGFRD